MKNFRVGIVGCGNIFPMHAVSLNYVNNAKISAVCDIREDRAKQKAEEFQCKYYLDYREMIDSGDIDVLHICTPHYLHAPICTYAANANIDVLTEKPMSIHLKDAESMIEAAKKNNVTLGVIFQNRYNPGSMLIKDAIISGKLGGILSARLSVSWKRTDEYYSMSDWKGTLDKEGGGVIIDQAIHTLDLLQWFVDSDIDFVEANTGNRTHSNIEVEDFAEGIIKFKNGVLTAFNTANYYSYDAPVEIEIHCENGIAKIIGDSGYIKFNDGTEYISNINPNECVDFGQGVKSYWGTSHLKQIKNFYQCLTKSIDPEITGNAAIKTQKLVCSIYDSAKYKTRIYL